MAEDSKLIPFGKYAGQPIEVLRNDPSYVQWLMGQDWFRNRFTAIHTLIVNNFGEPTETPEHNTLQAQFLDDGFCRKLLAKLEWPPVTEGARFVRERRDEHLEAWLAKAEATLSEFQKPSPAERSAVYEAERYADNPSMEGWVARIRDTAAQCREKRLATLAKAEATIAHCRIELAAPSVLLPKIELRREFEARGWDVCLAARAAPPLGYPVSLTVYIELKPTLRDDFPAVLRQMKANRRVPRGYDHGEMVLIFDRFTASVTCDQMKAMFAASGFRVFTLAEIAEAETRLTDDP
jgi:hypothetical protein